MDGTRHHREHDINRTGAWLSGGARRARPNGTALWPLWALDERGVRFKRALTLKWAFALMGPYGFKQTPARKRSGHGHGRQLKDGSVAEEG